MTGLQLIAVIKNTPLNIKI